MSDHRSAARADTPGDPGRGVGERRSVGPEPRPAAGQTRRVLREAIPPVRRLWPAILLGIGSAGSSVALLAASAWLITRAAEQPPILFLSMAVVGVRAFALSRATFRYLERLTGHDAAFRQLGAIRTGIYERMLPSAPDGLGVLRRGDLLSRFVGDVDDLQFVTLRAVQPAVSAVLVLIAAVAGVMWLAPGSGFALLGCLVVGVTAAVLAERAASARGIRLIAPLRGELQAAIVEHVAALDTLVAFDAAAASRARIERLGARLARATRVQAAAAGASAAIMAALGGLAALASIGGGLPRLTDGSIDGPAFAVLCLVPLAIAEVAAALPVAVGAWRTARVSAERIATAVPETPPAGVPQPASAAHRLDDATAAAAQGRRGARPVVTSGARDLGRGDTAPAPGGRGGPPPSDGDRLAIELRGVRAHWPVVPGQPEPAGLEHPVDLDLAPGERVLLRGPSGSGKTTLAHALVRFLEYEGSYRLGGVEVRELDPSAVRRAVGLVEQRPWLFDEDVRQNLLFARDTATDDELLAVLDRVGLAEWVRERGGLDVRVGERGTLVSGGQAQRIALARAMLADFPVIVLDEPTANVDPATAGRLLDDLLAAAGDRAVLLIMHTEQPPPGIDRVIDLPAVSREPSTSARSLG
ncbi:thiol reductant ABC exporter subunit CydC [Agromyces aerolatus]|uniref:thiol reductant ABC exporter subunit CydC n=1 Tax=Agromyces sp. LY-1074 TaxID=3074080 RepID=UPI0028551590|nr:MULTISPECIES: thiol reductant ABC exporter subunit CydC [unclassified Agromyces]MDR5700742.1 thiol reductant ABC exporter subunit CydC [Agromyces sp. LY-1074]MDR5707263.1 thiol reductant ABC exporter subunit CydC [Agromyces sp. LY-1358]